MQLHRRALLALVLAVLGTVIWWKYVISPTTVVRVGNYSKSSSSSTPIQTSIDAVTTGKVSNGNRTTFVLDPDPTFDDATTITTTTTTKNDDPIDHRRHLPIFQVGLPKSGTTTVALAFQCSGIHTSHYCCCGSNQTHPPCFEKKVDNTSTPAAIPRPSSMGQCLYANVQAHRPILHDCGNYTFYGQLDAEMGKHGIFLPQHDHLQALHDMAPHATFLLTLRQSPELWATSVLSWFGLGMRFRKTFSLPIAAGISLQDKTAALANLYEQHTQRVREFVRDHPSHRLVEVIVEDPQTPSILAKTFGIDPKCWGWHNKGPNHKKKKGRKHPTTTPAGSTLSNETKVAT